jgi:hypothetical protein
MRNRACVESEMTEEMRFHLDSYVEDLCRKGFPRAEAMRRAGLEFGGMEARKEECRESLGLPLWDEMRGDRDNCGSSTGRATPQPTWVRRVETLAETTAAKGQAPVFRIPNV